jgi:hypothetical protein
MGKMAELTAVLLATALKTQYESDGGYCIRLYGTPQRADTADSVGAAVLLCILTSSSNPLEFEIPTDQVLSKSIIQTWEGSNVASGTALWGCLSPLTDTGAASTAIHRFDFSVGLWTDSPLPDYKMSNNILILSEITRMNQASFTIVRDVSDI